MWQSLWRFFLESLHVYTTQIRNKWDCWNSSALSKGRHLCCIVAIRSGRWVVGGVHGVLHLSATCPRPLGRNENSLWMTIWRTIQRTNISFGAMVEYHPISMRIFNKTSSIWQESISWYLSWIWIDRGRNVERRYSFWLRTWEKMDASESYPRRIHAKEVWVTQKRRWIQIPSSRWYSKIVRTRLRLPRTHSMAGTDRKERRFQWRTSRCAEIEELEKLIASETYPRRLNAKEVLITPKRWRIYISCGRWFSNIIRKRLRIPRTHSETGIHRKERESQRKISWRLGRVSTWRIKRWRWARLDFWSIPGDFIYRRHNEPRVQIYVPKEETFRIPLQYIDITRSTHTDLDVLQEKRTDDYWKVDFNRRLSDS